MKTLEIHEQQTKNGIPSAFHVGYWEKNVFRSLGFRNTYAAAMAFADEIAKQKPKEYR